MHNYNNKKKATSIITNLYKDKNCLSVTLTGSYSEHFDLKKAGDIDIIIICKNLNQKYFKNCIKKLQNIKKKYLVINKS